jgi:hypothetical protein
MESTLSLMNKAARGARELLPYAAVELLLPGGSVVAALMWLYRRRRAAQAQQVAQS